MNSTNRMVCVVAGVVMLALPSLTSALDWPQWRGPNRDAKVAGFDAPETWPKELTQKWKVAVGDGVSTPALANDKLYVFARQGDDEVTRCLDANTGKEIWQDKYASDPASGPASRFPGPRSSPTVADGKVITYGVRGVLSCLDAKTGKVLWRKDEVEKFWPRFFTSSSPIVVDGLCIAQLGGEDAGAIVAYELETGNEKWKWTEDGTAYASPVLLSMDGAPIVIAETDDRIVGLAVSDGQLAWETPYPLPGRRDYNAATPIVDGETIIYAGSSRGTTAARISKQDDALAAQELWSNQDNSVQYNSPVLKDGLVYGLSNRDVLFCINAESGTTAWTAQLGTRGSGRPGYGSVVDAGSVMFALTPAAQLIVFEPSDKEFKQIASYKVSDSETYAYPIVDGNRVFIKDSDSVTLWSIE